MCVIVDANVASRVFLSQDDPEYGALRRSLFGTKQPIARVAYGGKLTDEYLASSKLRRILVAMKRAGRARLVADEAIERETRKIEKLCTSNDKHIIGLARAGGVRILCSDDRALCADFWNKALVDKPIGRVYRHREHQKLLVRYCRGI